MDLDKITLGELRQLKGVLDGDAVKKHPYKIGEKYMIRTVTMFFTGRLVAVYDDELVIEDAAWIADTGRWNNALRTGEFNEVEPFLDDDDVIVSRGAIIDVVRINFDLPREIR